MEIVPEPEWEKLLEILKKNKGTIPLLGATNSGKSTLARYMIKRLVSENIRVSLVDSDIGQSSLGLPGTISMKVFRSQKDVQDFRFERMYFVGSTNPAAKIPSMIEGTKSMVDICKEKSEIVFIDTTGLIWGKAGMALKIGKIKAIKPGHVIALEARNELGKILNLIGDIPVYRIRPSHMVKARTRASRIKYRKKRFDEYFNKEETGEFLLGLKDVDSLYRGKPLSPGHKDFQAGRLIGLNHDQDTLALGIVTGITPYSLTLVSPIKSLQEVNRVVLGDMVIQGNLVQTSGCLFCFQ